jgi:hypothetical protein
VRTVLSTIILHNSVAENAEMTSSRLDKESFLYTRGLPAEAGIRRPSNERQY